MCIKFLQLHDDLPGVRNLLERLIPKQNAPFLSRLEEIAEVNADTVNLPSTADTEYHSQQSRYVCVGYVIFTEIFEIHQNM